MKRRAIINPDGAGPGQLHVTVIHELSSGTEYTCWCDACFRVVKGVKKKTFGNGETTLHRGCGWYPCWQPV